MTEIFNTENLLKQTGLFWQYPVITEKEFYNQNKKNPNYCGIPWATVIDKRVDTNAIFKILLQYIKHKHYYTCCQHISFRKLIPLMKLLGITTLYTPHKVKGEDNINGITIKPCPLYAVNIEDPHRNQLFKNVNYETVERPYLYSFVGGYQPNNYLTNIREKIFTMNKHETSVIINTGSWHFNNHVYSTKQNVQGTLNENDETRKRTNNYNDILLKSRFSLCPGGSGPNSIRFWESLAVGSIPVLLADTLDLPEYIEWEKAIVFLKENELETINNVLNNIDVEKEKQMRMNCINIYNKLKNNYKNCKNTIIHYCCGSYDIGDFGGVARYDYHISLLYPHRIFVKGPQQKKFLLDLLVNVDEPLVITDNHLSCDIPNTYNILLVHHGSALTHAEREPQWSPYWKKLCCNGQENMLNYREPEKTKIISISQFCYDEFMRFFPKIYPTFDNKLILHTSELNKNKYKITFNDKPNVLGNFKGFIKGEHIYNKLKSTRSDFVFNTLNISYNKNKHKSYEEYNKEKQQIYINNDIFLQLSLCEGYSYATLDAFLSGNVIVATDVGLTYKDVPEDCYVKLDYTKITDINYILDKLQYAWENKETLSKNAREFYLENCNMNKWKKDMNDIVYKL